MFKKISQNELLKHVGNISQIAGIRESVLSDGRGKGVRVADFYNGSGLNFTVLLDRGMDIGRADYAGISLAWLSPAGYTNPAFYESEGNGWLRSWCGGLLTGCGLTNVGTSLSKAKCGVHGRLSHLPAEKCACMEEWIGNRYKLSVSGKIRESCVFGENLAVKRSISTWMGDNVIEIRDCIVNQGYASAPCMILYHINLGYPLLSPASVIKTGKDKVVPRDKTAAKGLNCWEKSNSPVEGFKEQCFYHDISADKNGFSKCSLYNPDMELEFEVAYRKKELPFLTQWKMMGLGEYVMGLEPGNCHVEGRIKEKEKFNTLKMLEPEESLECVLKMTIKTTSRNAL